jgi:hypothetical protein
MSVKLTVEQLEGLVEDAECVLQGGDGWTRALDRLGKTVGQLDYMLRQAGRADLIGSLKAADRRQGS